MSETIQTNSNSVQKPSVLAQVFDDIDAKNNVVGLFDLLLKIDKRIHPEKYD